MALAQKPAEIVAKSKSGLLAIHESWLRINISDIAEILNGYAFKSAEFTKDEGTPLIRIRDVGKDKTHTYYTGEYDEQYLVKKGDLLVGMDGDFRCSVWRGEDALLNQRVCKISLKTGSYDFGFLTYALQPYLDAIHAETSAVTVKHLSSKSISEIPLPLPPLQQQKRIVAKIEELFSHIDAGIAALNKAKKLLKQYRQSVLKAAVTGELTKQWREENKDKLEPASKLLKRILSERRQKWEEQQLEQFKAKGKEPKNDKWKEKYKELDLVAKKELKELPGLPEGWTYTRLGNLIEDPKYGTSKKCAYDENGLGVLRIPNVANGKVDAIDLKFAEFDDREIDTYQLQKGDILTIRSNGSVSLVGKCALIAEADEKYLYAGYLIRLRPIRVLASSNYLIHSLSSIYLRQQIESKAKSTSGVNNINSGELQSIIIAVCPLKEQLQAETLVDIKLDAIQRLVGEIEVGLLKAEKNKQSILVSAFSGNLVSYVDGDGNASELLAEIRDQKITDKKKEKLEKKSFSANKKSKPMRKKVIEILKSSKVPLSPERIFEMTGRDHSSIDQVEDFYIELKQVLSVESVVLNRVWTEGVKERDEILYKVKE